MSENESWELELELVFGTGSRSWVSVLGPCTRHVSSPDCLSSLSDPHCLWLPLSTASSDFLYPLSLPPIASHCLFPPQPASLCFSRHLSPLSISPSSPLYISPPSVFPPLPSPLPLFHPLRLLITEFAANFKLKVQLAAMCQRHVGALVKLTCFEVDLCVSRAWVVVSTMHHLIKAKTTISSCTLSLQHALISNCHSLPAKLSPPLSTPLSLPLPLLLVAAAFVKPSCNGACCLGKVEQIYAQFHASGKWFMRQAVAIAKKDMCALISRCSLRTNNFIMFRFVQAKGCLAPRSLALLPVPS